MGLYFISEEGLQKLKAYKYVSGEYTWLDNKLNPYWLRATEMLPLWVAPNLITFVGFLFIVVAYLLMLCYDFTFKKEIPSWVFLFASFAIFVYQTLDAMDGKQARRTKSSSALGQLFDHGCDSFVIIFGALMLSQAAGAEFALSFFFIVVSQGLAFSSNWIQRHTGVLNTQIGNIGVTEIELLLSGMMLVSAVGGQSCWSNPLSYYCPHLALYASNLVLDFLINRFTLLKFMTFVNVVLAVLLVVNVVIEGRKFVKKEPRCLEELVPFLWLQLNQLALGFFWQPFQEYAALALINFGILFSMLICKFIVCSTTKMAYPVFHLELLVCSGAVGLLVLGQGLGRESTMQVFWAYSAVNLGLVLKFLCLTVHQITTFLGIKCFSIPLTDDKAK